MKLSYAEQPNPEGLAQAFIIGADFLGGAPSALILGDNLFYGHDLANAFSAANARTQGATIFGYHVACLLYTSIPFDSVDNPRNYLTKLMRYPRLLEATNSISELDEFVAATFDCWSRRVPFGTYNVTNPGKVTTHEVVELIRRSGVCTKEFSFFSSEKEFMEKAAKTPRSNCVMDPSKLAGVGIRLTPVHEAIERDLRAWRKAA